LVFVTSPQYRQRLTVAGGEFLEMLGMHQPKRLAFEIARECALVDVFCAVCRPYERSPRHVQQPQRPELG
jgi:hypothetical protein